MSAFSSAIDTIFSDPLMAEDATWMEGGVPPGLEVRIIRRRPDGVTEFSTARIVQPAITVDLRISEVVAPRKDDILKIGEDFFAVQSAPLRDSEGLVWRLDLRPA